MDTTKPSDAEQGPSPQGEPAAAKTRKTYVRTYKHDVHAAWIRAQIAPPLYRKIGDIARELREVRGCDTTASELSKWVKADAKFMRERVKLVAPIVDPVQYAIAAEQEVRRRATDFVGTIAAQDAAPAAGQAHDRRAADRHTSPNHIAGEPPSTANQPASPAGPSTNTTLSASNVSKSMPAVSRHAQSNAAPAQGAGNAGEADSGSGASGHGSSSTQGGAASAPSGVQAVVQRVLENPTPVATPPRQRKL